MIFTRKITQIGRSNLGITLPREFIDNFHLGKGDTVKLSLELLDILKNDEHYKTYKCRVCGYVFDTEDEFVECPSCDSPEVIEIEEYVNDRKVEEDEE